MAIRLYIGYSEHTIHTYFINPRGLKVKDEHTSSFKDINSLLNFLNDNYKKRKAYLTGISEKMSNEDQQHILDFIVKKELKIITNSDLVKEVL